MVSFWALGIANTPLMGVTNSWLKKSRSRNIASAPSNERVHISSSGSILVALNGGMLIAINAGSDKCNDDRKKQNGQTKTQCRICFFDAVCRGDPMEIEPFYIPQCEHFKSLKADLQTQILYLCLCTHIYIYIYIYIYI
jgi:hypothetical protein